MKIPLSYLTYEKLIVEAFGNIFENLISASVLQRGMLFYELGNDKIELYPNFEWKNGKAYPVSHKKDYVSDASELMNQVILPKMKRKYESFQNINFEYFSNDRRRRKDYTENNGSFSDFILDNILREIDLTNKYANPESNIMDKVLENHYGYFQKGNRIEIENNKINIYSDKIHSRDFNVLCLDELYFLDIHFSEVSEDDNLFNFRKKLLEIGEIDNNEAINPIVLIYFQHIVNMFIFTSYHYDKILIQNYNNTLNEIPEKKDTEYIRDSYSNSQKIIIEMLNYFNYDESYYSYFKFSHISPQISKFYAKILILLINDKTLYENDYTEKFYEFINTTITNEETTGHKEIILDKILNKMNSKPFKSKLSKNNVATLFYLLKSEGIIYENLNNTELSIIINLMTGHSNNTISDALSELNTLHKNSSSKFILKQKANEKFSTELKEILKKILEKL